MDGVFRVTIACSSNVAPQGRIFVPISRYFREFFRQWTPRYTGRKQAILEARVTRYDCLSTFRYSKDLFRLKDVTVPQLGDRSVHSPPMLSMCGALSNWNEWVRESHCRKDEVRSHSSGDRD
jgi:hypothetical protein